MNTDVIQITFDENFVTNFEACVQTQAAAGRRLASAFIAPGTIQLVLLFVS